MREHFIELKFTKVTISHDELREAVMSSLYDLQLQSEDNLFDDVEIVSEGSSKC